MSNRRPSRRSKSRFLRVAVADHRRTQICAKEDLSYEGLISLITQPLDAEIWF